MDVLGLSGLITPSDEMIHNAQEMQKRAQYSSNWWGNNHKAHTAIKIAHHYEAVVQVPDASLVVNVVMI